MSPGLDLDYDWVGPAWLQHRDRDQLNGAELMQEVWQPVTGYEGLYEVSDLGRVRSLDRVVQTTSGKKRCKGKLLTPSFAGQKRYLRVSLSRLTVRYVYVHALVAVAFHGPRPLGMECCHCNGNHLDNRAANLRWDTRSSNIADRKLHGTHACGERVGSSKLTRAEVLAIRQAEGTCAEIGAKFGIGPMQVSKIKRKLSWAWLATPPGSELIA